MAQWRPWQECWSDYLAVLGLKPGFTEAQLKTAYRARARRAHPDVCPDDPGAHVRFLLIREALEVLRDPLLREAFMEAWRARQVPPCAQAGCHASSTGTCASCGHPVCTSHRHTLFTERSGKSPGAYCPECLPRCRCGTLFDPKVAGYPRAKAERVRLAHGQNLLCPDCLGSVCDDPSCTCPEVCTCHTCGSHLCEKHALKGEAGFFCPTCIERCKHCHAPIQAPTPKSLQPAEEGLRKGNSGKGRWCHSCLTHGPFFTCERCGRKKVPFGTMAKCKPCGNKWLCDRCHPCPSTGPCPRCRRIKSLERQADFWSRSVEWSYLLCVAVGCVTPMALFLGKHKLLEALRTLGQGNGDSVAMVVVLLWFLIPSSLVGILPGFCLGLAMGSPLRCIASSFQKRAEALRGGLR